MLVVSGYLVFILSVAFAAGGVVLATRLRNKYNHEIFSLLLYYQVFIYTFGFYGVWGQQAIKFFLANFISAEVIERISEITLLLGLPFLVFAWLMLIQFSFGISGRTKKRWLMPAFLLANFSVILLLGYKESDLTITSQGILTKYYYVILLAIYSVISAALSFFAGKNSPVIHDFDRKKIAAGIFAGMLLQCLALSFYNERPVIGLAFIFVFFGSNVFLPVYLSYGTLLQELTRPEEKAPSFVDFCRKFEISPRESDIIREICNGLSNKEISEKLFISLQTVKDHTHRIYIKTNVKSRVQLIYQVKEFIL
jgi:DNA-binding CsgD family transcriptional regulator